MSLKASTLVWERTRAKGSNLLMLLAIADYAKDDGRWAYPSAGTLGRKSRLTGRGGELVLRKLVADREVTPEWSARERRLYLHIRCIADWPIYQAEKPAVFDPDRENFSRNHTEKFSLRLVALARRAANAGGASPKNPDPSAKTAAASAKTAAASLLSGSEGSRDDPYDPDRAGAAPPAAPVDGCGKLGDDEGRAKPPARPSPPVPGLPAESLGVITKVVHELGDLLGPFDTLGDLTEAVKAFCARPPGGGDAIPYNTAVVLSAIDSATVQRSRAGKRPLVKPAPTSAGAPR